FTYIL
ncbi:hypothetical protein Hypma_008350, partial [Hypsizygus marmoreus]